MEQSELFQDLSTDQRSRRLPFPLFPGRFLHMKVAYEDMVFGALGLVLLLLGGFCLGVERGKSLVSKDPVFDLNPGVSSTVAHAARSIPEPDPISAVMPAIPAAVSLPPQEAGVGTVRGSYAIQLASYVGMASAQEEVRRLTRQGIAAQVVRQGKYFELRAVGFRSWSQAKDKLAGLRKTYRDAFIKRLSSSGG
ncbi:MAG: SPOR domain-containing protein [Candidatus Omnitrophica bacterium]|nr:SPOR domain-containing protein [Candidatus Omnitrophota bacterium]